MAAPLTIGLRLPGSPQLRLRPTRLDDLAVGEWVAVPAEWGEDAGRVVYAADHLLLVGATAEGAPIERRLSSDQQARAAELSQTALELMPEIAQLPVCQTGDVHLAGLRFTLDGRTAVVSGLAADPAPLLDGIARLTGVAARFEPIPSPQFAGGLGRLSPRIGTVEQRIEAWLDQPLGPVVFAPEGLPRLGTPVATEHGPGRLVGVAVKHRRATIRLSDGREVEVPVDELRPASN